MSEVSDRGRYPLRFLHGPLERFFRTESASGILLVAGALVALLWANSPWAEGYAQIWQSSVGVHFGEWGFERTLEWIVNDVLMVIFFFVVGLEMRLEIHQGEMSEWRSAALPAAAALGGMLVPAALYLAVAGGAPARTGWGVPMATDIAFAVGILTLLGRRIPASLRVLLLALAVIDDLGAIVVIAVFYSRGIELPGLLLAVLGVGGIFVLRYFGVRTRLAYIAPSVVLWAGIYAAGIHPTIAGVIVGLLTPVRPGQSSRELAGEVATSPAEGLIRVLQPWVAFAILPIFAVANAGVAVSGLGLDAATSHIVAAVSVGLVIGKPLGVLLGSWLVLRLGIGTLPEGVRSRHLWVLGTVAGVGFTMALFIADLAFTDARSLAAAKLGILGASAVAAVLSLILGRFLLSPLAPTGEAVDASDWPAAARSS